MIYVFTIIVHGVRTSAIEKKNNLIYLSLERNAGGRLRDSEGVLEFTCSLSIEFGVLSFRNLFLNLIDVFFFKFITNVPFIRLIP